MEFRTCTERWDTIMNDTKSREEVIQARLTFIPSLWGR